MSHGLRSKECAGHKSLLIIPSANTPLRASMHALAVQTVVECTTTVLYWSAAWKIAEVFDPHMFQN